MADKVFKDLLTEQKKTNKLLAAQGGDASAQVEIEEEKQAGGKKERSLLSKIAGGVTGTFGVMKGIAGKFKPGAKTLGFLKGLVIAGALAAIVAFLNSEYWIKTKKWIVEVGAPMLKNLWEKVIKPLGIWFKDKFIPFFEDLGSFIKDPSWDKFKTLIADNKAAVGLLAAALAVKTLGIGTITTGLVKVATTVATKWGIPAVTTALGSTAVVAALSVAGIVTSLALAVKGGFDGVAKSEEWGATKTSSAIGGVLAGTKSGWRGAFQKSGHYAMAGASTGLAFGGPPGALVGGLIGAVIGAIFGWIGGERIAKFFDKVGVWASEKWDVIKLWPGKIWTAIVDTIKGWIGLGPTGELPVDVDEPQKDWLTKLTDFLIPQWLRDFAKDALGTVTGWLGLTEKDDQGNITTTEFGKKVFGTLGDMFDIAMKVIKFFIPRPLIDFAQDPINTVLGWMGMVKKDEETGEVTATEFGKKVFGTVIKIKEKVKNFVVDIVKKVVGEDRFNAIVAFAKNPIDYILVNWLKWKDEAGKPTAAGIQAVTTMEEEGFIGWTQSIIKGFIGEENFNAIAAFAKNPIDYILVNWLGWKKKDETLGEAAAAATGRKDFNLWDLVGLAVEKIKQYFWDDDGTSGLLQFEIPKIEMPDFGLTIKAIASGLKAAAIGTLPLSGTTAKEAYREAYDKIISEAEMPKSAMGGVFGKGLRLVGEQGPEVVNFNGVGHIMNAQRTDAMRDAMLRRSTSGLGGGGQAIIAPTTVANTNSTNITHTTTSLVNPDLVVSTINKAA